MTNIIEFAVHRARRRGDYSMSSEEAARLRGFIRWKINNKRAMDERDEVTTKPTVTPKPWPGKRRENARVDFCPSKPYPSHS